MNNKLLSSRAFLSITFALSAVLLSSQSVAGTIAQCGQATCSAEFSIFVDGSSSAVGGGQLLYDAETGEIALDTENGIVGNGMANDGGLMWTMGDGSTVRVNSLSGNADPILGFGLGATTGANGHSYSFAFNLPIAFQGGLPVNASSSVSYSLTSLTNAGAEIKPLVGGNVVIAQDIDTSIGGLPNLDKGVNVGDTFGFLGGPQVQNSPVYTASNQFLGDAAYDLMAVTVGFSLSANSSAGISGFVEQTEVPIPAAAWLFGSAVLGLMGFRRRSVVA